MLVTLMMRSARSGGLVCGRLIRARSALFCSTAGGVTAPAPALNAAADATPSKAAQAVPPPPPATTWHTLVIGEIVSFEPHPTADRLNVCQVDIGDRENLLQIVCGAPNVRQGARVPVAKVGSKLALKDPASGDIKLVKIKKSKLRGEVSQGMICSEAELGLADESDGILIFDGDAPIGSLVQDWRAVASRLVQPSSTDKSDSGA